MKRVSVYIAILLCIGCRQTAISEPTYVKNELKELSTISDRTEYLEKIYRTDQKIRNGRSSELVLKYGVNSTEVLDFYHKMDSIDRLNFKRIEFYLEEFGYPNFDSTTREANTAPWLVIHHCPDLAKRKEFFPILNKAFTDGDINLEQFEMYLGRTYRIEFGSYPSGEGAYDPYEKINRLIKELDLIKTDRHRK